jgi:hypothetical protein
MQTRSRACGRSLAPISAQPVPHHLVQPEMGEWDS